ncbi:MAG: ParB/RepB/Spo0J family partition protein [Chloroflexota bacterium]
MTKKRGGLGRGLGALIPPGDVEQQPDAGQLIQPETTDELVATGAVDAAFVAATAVGLFEVPIESISPNPHQPRQGMPADKLEELADSIREHGVLQPLVVTGTGNGTYALIAGERRWRAARVAGLETVPVIVKEVTSSAMLELALVENLQRSDLNPIEEAHAFRALVEEFGLRQEDVADRVGKSRSAITNSLRLLALPPEVQESLLLGMIEAGHARAILQVPTTEGQLRLLELTVADGMSVRQVEALARRMAEAAGHEVQTPRPVSPMDDALYDELRTLEDRFRNALGTKVQLSRSSRGGKLVIYFYSEEELDRIYGTIVGEEE